jgi:hypothetical protein
VTSAVQTPVPTDESGVTAPAVEETYYEDYFGFEANHEFVLPDGRQKIFFKAMNEGAKTKYQQKINRDIHLNRASQDVRVKTDPAGERHELIMASVTGWSLMRRDKQGQWVPAEFSNNSPGSTLAQWLDKADPVLVEKLETAIRKANPWMIDDMTIEQVDEEIGRLTDLRKDIVARKEKEADFPR